MIQALSTRYPVRSEVSGVSRAPHPPNTMLTMEVTVSVVALNTSLG
jgi:hypothetical protein